MYWYWRHQRGKGEGPIEAIIEARNKGGDFLRTVRSLRRTDTKKLTGGCWKPYHVLCSAPSWAAPRGADELAG
ncbi:hypothetical protein ACLK19_01430 [Escherichia coli]